MRVPPRLTRLVTLLSTRPVLGFSRLGRRTCLLCPRQQPPQWSPTPTSYRTPPTAGNPWIPTRSQLTSQRSAQNSNQEPPGLLARLTRGPRPFENGPSGSMTFAISLLRRLLRQVSIYAPLRNVM